jgi:TolB protein
VQSDGSGFRILTSGDASSDYQTFSPDGKNIVYRVLGEGERGLRIMLLADGKITKLTTEWDNFPSWSPAGDRIMFTRMIQGDFEIFTIRPDGSGLRQLTHDHGNDAHSQWSHDGKWIVFTSSRMGWKDDDTQGQNYREIFVMRENGSDVRQLTDNKWEDAYGDWLSPSH